MSQKITPQNKFDSWNKYKIQLNEKDAQKIFNEGEIWFLSLGKNVGFEEDGKGEKLSRPILIIKKFNHFIFYGIPLTSVKKENKFHFGFDGKTGRISYAILSQMRLFDSKRLENKIGSITYSNMKILKNKLKELIFQ